MISADRNRVHDKFAALVVVGSTISYVVWIVFSSEVVSELMSGYKICFLERQYITVLPDENI